MHHGRPILLTVLVLASLVLAAGCPLFPGRIEPPDNVGVLFNPSAGPIPAPGDLGQLQNAYYSPQGKAMISVFPGTTEPPGGLTITEVDFDTLPRDLQENRPDFGVVCGPDGTEFDTPVRVSLLVGEAIETDEGQEIPEIEVQTLRNGRVRTLAEERVQMELTHDGLLIAHAIVDHFTPVTYKVGAGVLARIYEPEDQSYHIVGGTPVPTEMRAKNKGRRTIRLTPAVTASGAGLGTPNYDNGAKLVTRNEVRKLAVGSCPCAKPGPGTLTFDLTGNWNLADRGLPVPIDRSVVLFRTFRDVECIGLKTSVTVTANGPQTAYSVKVEHATRATGYKYENATFSPEVEYKWSHISTCGVWDLFDTFYNYEWIRECTPEQEETAIVQCKVTYTLPNGEKVERVYRAGGRENEGAGPVAF